MRHSRLLALTLLSSWLHSAPALAGEWPHERSGFVVGLHLGVGRSEIETALVNEPGGAAAGGAATLRVGYAVAPELVLAAEAHGWSNDSFGVTQSLSLAGIGLIWYPQRGGLFVRGTLGGGETVYRSDSTNDVTLEGPAIGLGVGYEWRVTRHVAIASELDLARTDFDHGHGQWASATLGCNVYP